jgi:hypothetical protein
MRSLIAIVAMFAFSAQPAVAATTVFAASVFSVTGSVTNAGNALGSADGSSTAILRTAGGSELILQMSQATSGLTTLLNGARLTGTTNVQIAVGEVIGGIATFSTNIALPGGFGPGYALNLSTACATVSAAGCSLLRIRVNGAPGGGFMLDGVSGVAAAPEPSMWALMLLGFGAVAWRLKQRRIAVPATAHKKRAYHYNC